jgi:hypothetical protein
MRDVMRSREGRVRMRSEECVVKQGMSNEELGARNSDRVRMKSGKLRRRNEKGE